MAVFRINKTKNYTVMSNNHLKNKNLSFKAKGLLSYMLSLPDNWDYSINGLSKVSKDKKDAVKGALKELKDNGYLEIKKYLPNENTTGRILYEYVVYEEPQTKKQERKNRLLFFRG